MVVVSRYAPATLRLTRFVRRTHVRDGRRRSRAYPCGLVRLFHYVAQEVRRFAGGPVVSEGFQRSRQALVPTYRKSHLVTWRGVIEGEEEMLHELGLHEHEEACPASRSIRLLARLDVLRPQLLEDAPGALRPHPDMSSPLHERASYSIRLLHRSNSVCLAAPSSF